MGSSKRVALALVIAAAVGAAVWAAESREEIIRRLWPQERCDEAMKDIEKQKADGLITQKMYERKKAIVLQRKAGTFQPTMLSATNPALNLLQNASFEDFNPNTDKNKSRWDNWGGWAWPTKAEYVNDKEDRPEYVKEGKLSARFKCVGAPARTGIQQKIPITEGATGYELTIWAKGEGENLLAIAFEAGAKGGFSEKIGPEWKQITLVGKPDPKAKEFTLWIYARGGGTIWLDAARMVPQGVKLED
ncbi:MAG: hypothetical protein ACE15C_11200 [Phycisphaerae bacterium]